MDTTGKLLERLKSESKRTFTLQIYKSVDKCSRNTLTVTDTQLTELLTTYSESENKDSQSLFHATCFSGTNRELDQTIGSDCLIFDLDGKHYSYSEADLGRIFGDYRFIAYETFSSNQMMDQMRWRIVLPLSRQVNSLEYDQLYSYFVNLFRLDHDPTTSRCNAIFYLPSTQVGDSELKKTINHQGAYLDPKQIVTKHKREQTLEYKHHRSLVNTDIRLSVNTKDLCGFSYVAPKETPISLAELKDLTCQPYVGLKLAELVGISVANCGIDARKGRFKSKSMKSVIPWHSKDDSPSTGLIVKTMGENPGRVLLRSFKSDDQANPLFDLHYIYACQQIGKQIPFERWTRSTSQIWLVRALASAGIIKLKDSKFIGISTDMSPGVTRLYESMKLLVRCREALSFYEDDAVIFSFTFAEIWCGISRQTVSTYFSQLVDSGIVEKEIVQTTRLKSNGFIPKYIGSAITNSKVVQFSLRDLADAYQNNIKQESTALINRQENLVSENKSSFEIDKQLLSMADDNHLYRQQDHENLDWTPF